MPTCSAPPVRHPRFYFPDGNLVLLAGSTLYCIHRYFFDRDSPTFKDMFTLPQGEGKLADGSDASPEGTSDDSPIELPDQSENDLECFLELLYPMTFQEKHDQYFWLSCLRFADKWDFEKQRSLALVKIDEEGGPAVRIAAARLCDRGIDQLIPAFRNMLLRQPPSYQDGEVLSMRDLVLHSQLQFYRSRFPDLDAYLRAVLQDSVEPHDLDGYNGWVQRQTYLIHNPAIEPPDDDY